MASSKNKIRFLKESASTIFNCGIEAEAGQAQNAVSILGGRIEKIDKFDLCDQKRSFVILRKQKKTPKGYPRQVLQASTPTTL